LRWWLIALVLGATLLALSFYFDATVVAWMAQYQDQGVRTFMRDVSRFGDWPGHMIVGGIGLLLARLQGNRKWMRIFAAMLLACALAGSVTRVIKIAAGRARPDVHSEVQWHGLQFRSRHNAFPSGHTAAS